MNFNDLISKISFTTFDEVIQIAPRKVRESLFSHYGIKTKGIVTLSKIKEKKEDRLKKLHEKLKLATNPKEQEFLKELFKNFLFTKRPMLKSALDFLGVKNDFGFVDEEPEFLRTLTKDKVLELYQHLLKEFPKDEIFIYLSFMEVPFVNEII